MRVLQIISAFVLSLGVAGTAFAQFADFSVKELQNFGRQVMA
jgi:hypothetical protein